MNKLSETYQTRGVDQPWLCKGKTRTWLSCLQLVLRSSKTRTDHRNFETICAVHCEIFAVSEVRQIQGTHEFEAPPNVREHLVCQIGCCNSWGANNKGNAYSVGTLEKQTAVHSGTPAVGSATKCKHIVLSISEPLKPRDQHFMPDVRRITSARDSHNCRLLFRLTAVNGKLQVRRGMLGLEVAPSGSVHILNGTEGILKRVCTLSLVSKRRRSSKQPLFKQMCAQITAMAVDSAADEILDAETMRMQLQEGCIFKKTCSESQPYNARFVSRKATVDLETVGC